MPRIRPSRACESAGRSWPRAELWSLRILTTLYLVNTLVMGMWALTEGHVAFGTGMLMASVSVMAFWLGNESAGWFVVGSMLALSLRAALPLEFSHAVAVFILVHIYAAWLVWRHRGPVWDGPARSVIR